MLEDLENSGEPNRLFSLLPQKELKPLHISINNTVLKAMHDHLQQTTLHAWNPELLGLSLWEYYFDFKRVTRRNKVFEEFIMTDGLSVSVTVSQPKRDAAPVDAQAARESASNAFLQAARVVSVDPGRNPIISGVIYNEGAMNALGNIDNIHLEKVKWSKKEHYHECGFTYRTSKTNLWMSMDEQIMAFNNQAITTKTSNIDLYKAHATHVLANLHQRMAFFNMQRFKRLRFKTYVKTQQAYEKVVAKLKGGVPNTLVVWGNAKFPPNGRGSPSVPTKTMRKKVQKFILSSKTNLILPRNLAVVIQIFPVKL